MQSVGGPDGNDDGRGPTVYLDAHCHLYPPFSVDGFLDGARSNLDNQTDDLAPAGNTTNILFLADPVGLPATSRSRLLSHTTPGSPWVIEDREAGTSVVASHRDGSVVYLVFGHQLETRSGLELLAMGCSLPPEDLRPDALPRMVDSILDRAGLAIIPWGLGKWTFDRRQVLRRLLDQKPGKGLFLADSAIRPARLPRSRLFRRAESIGIPVLAGSDPLPLGDQERRAGQLHSRITGRLDPSRPWRSLRKELLELDGQPAIVGARDSLMQLLASQIRLRISRP